MRGVTPHPLVVKLRELLLLGWVIQNQATSVFIYTMPDQIGGASIFQMGALAPVSGLPGPGASDDIGRQRAGAPVRPMQVRKVGMDLIATAGGQFNHPVKAVDDRV